MLGTTALVSSSFMYIVMSMCCCLLCLAIIRQKQRQAYLKNIKKKSDELLRASDKIQKAKDNVPSAPKPYTVEQKLESGPVGVASGKGKLFIASDSQSLHNKEHKTQFDKYGTPLGKCINSSLDLTDNERTCINFEKIGIGAYSYGTNYSPEDKTFKKHEMSTKPYYLRNASDTKKCLYYVNHNFKDRDWSDFKWGDCPTEEGKPTFVEDKEKQLAVFEDNGQQIKTLPNIDLTYNTLGCLTTFYRDKSPWKLKIAYDNRCHNWSMK
jgi:hypothetical protein